MTSNIDATKPGAGTAYTADVRSNFAEAAAEINNLQSAVGTNETDISVLQDDMSVAQGDITTLQNDIMDLQTALNAAQNDIVTLKARQQTAGTLITANPPNTNSNVFVAAGIGIQFTPTNDTRLIIMLDGMLGNTANNGTADLQLVYGTGTSPAAGILVTATNGTLVGNLISIMATKPNDLDPFGVSTMLTGLVSGQQYWLDAAYRGAGGAATLSQMSLTAFEVLDPLP
jgi:hypothetical protein